MIEEKEVRERIKKVTKSYWHVLDCYPATVQINAPRALMQLEATSILDSLYYVLGEERPKFKCDESDKLNY
ncbi:hypothetical protein KAW50_03435 [candidate division WOR-3 bacterium]|nr:hypothetical protein [candidate division WOR-3 bacterium]